MQKDIGNKNICDNSLDYNNLLITQIKKGNDLDPMRHFPSSIKYWYNSVYFFDKNYTKNLLYLDIIANKIIKMYFNLKSNLDKDIKFTRRRNFLRYRSTNRIFTSRAEIKHFNDKVVVTIYTYNRIKMYYLENLAWFGLYVLPFLYKESEKGKSYFEIKDIKYNRKEILDSFYKDKLLYKKFKFVNKEYNNLIYKLNYFSNNNLVYVKNHIKNKLSLNKFKSNYLNNLKLFKSEYYNMYVKSVFKKELLYLKNYKLLFTDYYKHDNIYLNRLNKLLTVIYKKKIEFNIINLKYGYFNLEIFLNSINLKMKNRNNRPIRILRRALNLPITNDSNIYNYNIKKKHIENYNRLSLNYNNLNFNPNNDVINFILNKIYKFNNKFYNKFIYKYIFRSIKLKDIRGIRLRAKGRITRRLTASRSVSKLVYKGSLSNIDSSINGLSAVYINNRIRSNLDYLNINSKTRNGSFGLRGWLSSK